jgi:hypothetical protein
MPLMTPVKRFSQREVKPGAEAGTVDIVTDWYFWDSTKRVSLSIGQFNVALGDIATAAASTLTEVDDWQDEYISGT